VPKGMSNVKMAACELEPAEIHFCFSNISAGSLWYCLHATNRRSIEYYSCIISTGPRRLQRYLRTSCNFLVHFRRVHSGDCIGRATGTSRMIFNTIIIKNQKELSAKEGVAFVTTCTLTAAVLCMCLLYCSRLALLPPMLCFQLGQLLFCELNYHRTIVIDVAFVIIAPCF